MDNSSFAPLDYYKKLTHCLANRKNCKVNLSKVPGAKEPKKNVFLTNEKVQEKFLQKYNERKLQQHAVNKPANDSNRNGINFVIKSNVYAGKRKKSDDENIVNLPSSFFKSFKPPDLSLFKIPEVPHQKKARLAIANSSISKAPSNFTLASIFSGTFNPVQASTPLEKPTRIQPIISDPEDIMREFIGKRKQDIRKSVNVVERGSIEKNQRLENYLKKIDACASKLDSLWYSNEDDPLDELVESLKGVYNAKQPRASLMGSAVTLSQASADTPVPSLPVPEFYSPKPNVMQKRNADNYESSANFNDTLNIFQYSVKIPKQHFEFEFGNDMQSNCKRPTRMVTAFTPFFEVTSPTADDSIFFSASNGFAKPSCSPEKDQDELTWLEDAFTHSFDIEWENKQRNNIANKKDYSIFHSPPIVSNGFERTLRKPINTGQLMTEFYDDNDNACFWRDDFHTNTQDNILLEQIFHENYDHEVEHLF
jgi:hypothetical protein